MLTRLTERRARQRGARAESAAETLDPLALKDVQGEANRLSRRLSRALRVAESRLSAPLDVPANQTTAIHSDWSWCPTLWSAPLQTVGFIDVASGTRVTADTAVFHDCPRREITLRQTRVANGLAPSFATGIDVLNFSGSYLSLALDLPQGALGGLARHHIITLNVTYTTERPVDVYARLNLRHGPNTEQVVAKLTETCGPQNVEFDLATTGLDETRLSRGWLDLIFETPAMNQIRLDHMTLERRLRADI